MEGTDAAIVRAGEIMKSLAGDASTLGRELTVVKIAKPNQDMRFDVPGGRITRPSRSCGQAGLPAFGSVDAGKSLLLDGECESSNLAATPRRIAIVADPNISLSSTGQVDSSIK